MLHCMLSRLIFRSAKLKLTGYSLALFFRISTDRIQQQLKGGAQYILLSMTFSSTCPYPMKGQPSMDPPEGRGCQGDQS